MSLSLDLVKLSPTSNIEAIRLDQLGNMVIGHVPAHWSFMKGPKKIALTTFSHESDVPQVSFCVTINEDFTWELSFEQITIPSQSLFMFKRKLTSVSAILGILEFLDNNAPSKICSGNDDEKFKSLPQYVKGIFPGKNGIYIHI